MRLQGALCGSCRTLDDSDEDEEKAGFSRASSAQCASMRLQGLLGRSTIFTTWHNI